MKLKDRLIKMNACSEAVEWVGDMDPKTAWAKCERGDWMLWYAIKQKWNRKKIVLIACDCARRALKYVPPGDDRPRLAIDAAELAARKPTKKNMAAAGDASDAACAANAAARAAAWAANAAARAAARAAVGAAWAAAEAAGAAESKAQADIVRKYFPRPRRQPGFVWTPRTIDCPGRGRR